MQASGQTQPKKPTWWQESNMANDMMTLFKVIDDLTVLQKSALPLQWERLQVLIDQYEADAEKSERDRIRDMDWENEEVKDLFI